MIALVVIQAFALVVLTVLVAGLLRSHAEILRTLHDLGAGEGGGAGVGAGRGGVFTRSAGGDVVLGPTRGPAGAATGGPAHDLAGATPQGSAVHLAVTGRPQATLLAFLTSGCVTCGEFWSTFSRPGGLDLPSYVDRLIVVTRGSDRESPAEVAARAPKASAGIPVVMSNEAWADYEVPVSPYFVLVDGAAGRVAGEGAARDWAQLESLLARALADNAPAAGDVITLDGSSDERGAAAGAVGRDGRPRRERADAALSAAGIEPGSAQLYRRA